MIGRKNSPFIGGPAAGARAATIFWSSPAPRHYLDIRVYLRDVLERLMTSQDVTQFLPDLWQASHPQALRTYRQREREAKADV